MLTRSRWNGRSRAVIIGGLVLSLYASTAHGVEQFRAFWADAFHEGFKSTWQIDNMVARAVQGRYNAIAAEIMPFQDRGSSHGAYWNSNIVPKASDIEGGIDPLAYLCQRAHASGIEVHAWILPFRACTSWPPYSNTTLQTHPEWVAVPEGNMGGGPAPTSDGGSGSLYMLDPGCPAVQDYLASIVQELCLSYEIDGINWDYIRYTTPDAGYPSNSTYNYSGLKRFQRITGYSGVPPTDHSGWNDFRRREIDELIRRCRAEIPSARANPRQPLRHTACVFATGSAPSTFESSAAYARFQNWRLWMQNGWLDATIPMNYKEEHCSEGGMFRSWVTAANNWKYNRHTFCGQANYQNTFPNSIVQMRYALDNGNNGVANYAYVSTRVVEEVCHTSWVNDWDWYAYTAANLFTSTATTPTMPWRNPATATEGTVWGRVKNWDTGQYVDNASVRVGTLVPVYTDGNGYYVSTLVPCSAGGTTYGITATIGGSSVTKPDAVIKAGDIVRCDLEYSTSPPLLTVSPTSFSRTVALGEILPPDWFDVYNANPGAMSFTVSENCSWMDLWPPSGTSMGPSDKVSVGIAWVTTELPAGTYATTITVTAPTSSVKTRTVTLNLRVVPRVVPADFDHDGDVDLADFGTFQNCLAGPGIPPVAGCEGADLDHDNDVDQTDRPIFEGCLSGSDVLGDPLCAG